MLTLERRFHFSSCSLIVRARRSLFSLWQPAAWRRSLRWELRFSPLTAEAQTSVLKGDEHQLQQLHQVVNQYLTTTLLARPDTVQLPLLAPGTKIIKPQPTGSNPAPTSTPTPVPTLVLRGLLAHELICGPLVSNQPQLLLGATQLADLALALDTYAQAQATQTLWASQSQRPWKPIALGSLALALLAILSSLYWQRSRAPVLSVTPINETAVADNPEVVPPTPLPTPTLLETPELPGDLAGLGPLKPPSGVNLPNRPLPPHNNAAIRSVPSSGSGTSISATPRGESEVAPESSTTVGGSAPQVPVLPPLYADSASAGNDLLPDAVAESAIATLDQDMLIALEPGSSNPAPRERGEDNAAAPSAQQPALPQVQEVQQYFAQRSPSGILPTDGVRYRLTIGAAGTLVRLRPLDATSTESLRHLAMPRLGEPFVSPLVGHRQAEIQLRIQPDGQVTTRLERVIN
ncbi:MAG: DUF4335 domain-containing protein [Cyanobacteria bacterium P01_G01_bin.54]